jgi:hypothetical protein
MTRQPQIAHYRMTGSPLRAECARCRGAKDTKLGHIANNVVLHWSEGLIRFEPAEGRWPGTAILFGTSGL